MNMENVGQRDDPSVDVVTLETPSLSAMLGTNSAAALPRSLFSFMEFNFFLFIFFI
ncbi:unnamed protein product [Gongylonema pulchrum]|uniref:Uncharacterized protein n=1 Tax=Gongylonema pulchrum TaxID=637853 RepID=A0A183EYK1_9BILA|nr:unnamed protein product [Gongylonema pulchrum]